MHVILVVLISIGLNTGVKSEIASKNDNFLCTTADCIRAAAHLLDSINDDVDPCEDFYQFTCGNWDKLHPRPVNFNSWSWFEILEEQIEQQIRRFLESKPSSSEPKAIGLSRTMYWSCMNASEFVHSYQIRYDVHLLFKLFDEVISHSDKLSQK